MKILFLQDDFPPQSFGGAGISTYELAIGMKNAGHEVFIITTCRSEADAGETEYHGLRIFKIASDYSLRWRFYVSLYNFPILRKVEVLLKEIKPDVVHANNIHLYLSYYCLKLAKQYARVVVFTARDTMSICYGKLGTRRYLKHFDYHTTWIDHIKQVRKRWNPMYIFLAKRYLGYADKLFSVSIALKKAFLQNGVKGVEIMHTGADVDLWWADEKDVVQFKEKHKLKNKKVVLFGGRLSEAKGGRITLKAMSEISKYESDAVLLVAGAVDWYAEQMKKEAYGLGIEDKLIFTGWMQRDEIKLAYATADMVLVPSLYLDPFPRIVIEAMASGKPVIGTCYGGAHEIIVDGVTGYIVNPLHPEEITEKTLDLLKNTKKAEEFGKAGYERVKTDFNLDKLVNEYIGEYETLLKKSSGKDS